MYLMKTSVMKEKVDIIGAKDGVYATCLSLRTHGAVCTTSSGENMLTMWHNIEEYGMVRAFVL